MGSASLVGIGVVGLLAWLALRRLGEVPEAVVQRLERAIEQRREAELATLERTLRRRLDRVGRWVQGQQEQLGAEVRAQLVAGHEKMREVEAHVLLAADLVAELRTTHDAAVRLVTVLERVVAQQGAPSSLRVPMLRPPPVPGTSAPPAPAGGPEER